MKVITSLDQKVLKLAAQICWMNGHNTCSDWSDSTDILDSLTPSERDTLMRQYEDFNSNGDDFEPGYFPLDTMMISFVVARALEIIAMKSIDMS